MKPIERISVADSVVVRFKEWITSGELTIGSKLPTEKEICKQLDIGRSSVREVFKVLKAMGYIKIESGKGVFVSKVKETDEIGLVS